MPKPNKAAVSGGSTVTYVEGTDHTYGFASVPSSRRNVSRREFFRVVIEEDDNDFATRWIEIGAVTKHSFDEEWSVEHVSPRYRTPEVSDITGPTAKATIEAVIEEIESWA